MMKNKMGTVAFTALFEVILFLVIKIGFRSSNDLMIFSGVNLVFIGAAFLLSFLEKHRQRILQLYLYLGFLACLYMVCYHFAGLIKNPPVSVPREYTEKDLLRVVQYICIQYIVAFLIAAALTCILFWIWHKYLEKLLFHFRFYLLCFAISIPLLALMCLYVLNHYMYVEPVDMMYFIRGFLIGELICIALYALLLLGINTARTKKLNQAEIASSQ